MAKTRNYDDSFKIMVIADALNGSVRGAAEEHGVSRDSLTKWMKDESLVGQARNIVWKVIEDTITESMGDIVKLIHDKIELAKNKPGVMTNRDLVDMLKVLAQYLGKFGPDAQQNVQVNVSFEDRIREVRRKKGLNE